MAKFTAQVAPYAEQLTADDPCLAPHTDLAELTTSELQTYLYSHPIAVFQCANNPKQFELVKPSPLLNSLQLIPKFRHITLLLLIVPATCEQAKQQQIETQLIINPAVNNGLGDTASNATIGKRQRQLSDRNPNVRCGARLAKLARCHRSNFCQRQKGR
ncbi:hypothetical protein [Ferrimonas senticii]|uniref:hypothetical protein n=1 Tax=Ferrimonas senticii TaxID=394566 RepID=UPI0012EBE8F8|nr:hypothetical protein [Ferrimonas senticii]